MISIGSAASMRFTIVSDSAEAGSLPLRRIHCFSLRQPLERRTRARLKGGERLQVSLGGEAGLVARELGLALECLVGGDVETEGDDAARGTPS